MKTSTILVGITMMLLLALPAVASEDCTLGIFGNANEDDTINMQDVTYTELIILEYRDRTDLADGKYDGKINMQDVTQIELVILGKEKELTFVDVIGEAETIEKPVERIIVVMSDAPEILRALDAVDKIVGVTDQAIRDGEVYSPELSKLPFVGTWRDIDHEAVLSLQPDVFMPYTPHATSESVWPSVKKQKAELKKKLPRVSIVALDFVTLTTFTENVRKLGYIIDREDEAEVFANWYDGYLNTIKDRTEGLSEDEKPRVFTMTYAKYKTGIPGSRYHNMMVIAGGRNIAVDLPIPSGGSTTSVTVDPEWVITQNPDIIIRKKFLGTPCYSGDDPADLIATWEDVINTPELANVNAVENRCVYTIANMLQTGPHCLIGLAYYVKWFHPDLYEDEDLDQIHQEYLDRFQHIDFDVSEHGVFVYHPVEHPDGR